MSPEQAQGESIDTRSDIFSLGVVLYEMIAGQQPFKGRTDSHTRVSIIDHDPVPFVQHVANVPRQLDRIVAKALAKDKLKRYQTITDLKLDLEQLRDEVHTSTGEQTVRSGKHSFSRNRSYRRCQQARGHRWRQWPKRRLRRQYDHRTAITNGLVWAVPAVLAAVSIAIIVYFTRHTGDQLDRDSSVRQRHERSECRVSV